MCEVLEGRRHLAAHVGVKPSRAPVVISAVSATPGTPDLVDTSDTGISNTDNLTNQNNSAADKTLQFSVPGTLSGAAVNVYSSGTLIGTATATGTTTLVTTFGTFGLADGLRSITARQTTTGNTQSPDSAALPMTIDTVAPGVSAPVFNFQTVKPQLTVTFTEPIVGFAGGSFTITKNTPPTGTTKYKATISGNTVVLTFPASPNGILANGDYTATVSPRVVVDAAGNVTTATTSSNFFVLAGDANRDRKVDFADFLILQTNYGSSVMDFTLGDFDYNGVVDFGDFLILQTNYGTSV